MVMTESFIRSFNGAVNGPLIAPISLLGVSPSLGVAEGEATAALGLLIAGARLVAFPQLLFQLLLVPLHLAKIGKQLGMDDDEVLRLSQIGGLADSFADRSFSQAWEIDGDLEGDE